MAKSSTSLLSLVALLVTSSGTHADLLHHWTFDETTGETATDSVGANNGTWQDPGANLTWDTGVIGNAAHLNDAGGGEKQHFDVGVLSSLAGAAQISISLWFNPDGETNYNGLFTSRTESNTGSWAVAWEGGNRVDFHTSGNGNQTDSEPILSAGNWYHVLAVWDNTTGNRTVYINGDPAGTGASVTGTFTDGSAFGGGGTWFIGTDMCCGDDRDFDGLIDDLAVFDSALTAADAAKIHTAGLAGTNVALALSPAPDVDDDGLDDPWEDLHFGDGDGTATAAELALQSGTDDGYPVADGDGLDNLGEQAAGTDPNVSDTDSDGANDGDEVSGALNPYKEGHIAGEAPGGVPGQPTNPLDNDSDNDAILDGEELTAGDDGFVTNPNSPDTDGDLMSDSYEVTNNLLGGLDPTDRTDDLSDLDGDGIENVTEYEAVPQTRADKADTDDDGYDDSAEDLFGSWESATATGTDPTNPDSDGDGLTDGMENPGLAEHNPPSQYKTDPNLFDSDGDTYGDGDEVTAGTDPADNTSFPPPPPGTVARIDFHMLDGTGQEAQVGWTPWEVSKTEQPASINRTIDGIGVTLTAGGGGYITARGGPTEDRGGEITGTSWNDVVENFTVARNGDGQFELAFTGLDGGGGYTLTCFHNDPYTIAGNPGFAVGDGVITPSITTGTLVGTAQDGRITNVRPGEHADSDFLNSVVAFTADASGNATVLLTSTTQFVVLNGFSLVTGAGASRLIITGTGFDGNGNFYLDVEGGVAGRKVTSADDLDFTGEVDVTTTDDGTNRFFISPANRTSAKDFFRVKELP